MKICSNISGFFIEQLPLTSNNSCLTNSGNITSSSNLLFIFIIISYVFLGKVDYKTDVDQLYINDVTAICLPTIDRGCSEEEKELFHNIARNIRPGRLVPSSLEEAKELYVSIRATLQNT